MPVHKVRERDIPALDYTGPGGTIVKVDVVEERGDTTKIRVQDSGVRVNWGDEYEVPSTAVHMWFDDL